MKKNNKQRLFEVMERINPDFLSAQKNDSENIDISNDVERIKNLTTPAQKKAYSRINSQREFNDAFDAWFNSLGFINNEYKNRINISTSISHITDIMEKNGIKH